MEDEIGVLRLHSWPDSQLPDFQQFTQAALSPSLERLLLISQSGNAKLLNLRRRREDADSAAAFRSPSPSTPAATSFASPTSTSTPFETPVRSSTPYYTPSSAFGAVTPSHCPGLAGVVSFAWGCQRDSYSVDGVSGHFQELLFTCGSRGFVIYGFAKNVLFDGSRESAPAPHVIDESFAFEVNADLRFDVDKVKLVFPESETWPEAISFRISYDSPSFSKLVMFANGVPQSSSANDTNNDSAGSCSITKLFSNSSNNILAMLLTDDCTEQACKQTILIMIISEWELRWISHVVLAAKEHWVDLALVSDRLLGLTGDGKVSIWAALTGEYITLVDVPRHCGLSGSGMRIPKLPDTDCFPFSQLVATESCLLIGVTDKLGRLFVVVLDEYFAGTLLNSFEAVSSCQDLKVLSIWKTAGSDIWNSQSHVPVPNRLWLSSISGRKVDNVHPPHCTPAGFSCDASGFTPKRLLTQKRALEASIKCKQAQPLRRVLLPLVPVSSIVAIAINSCVVTRLIRNPRKKGLITLVQSRLHCTTADTGDYLRDVEKNYPGEALGFFFQGSLYVVSAGSLDVVLPPMVVKSKQVNRAGLQEQWWLTDMCLSSRSQSILPLDSHGLPLQQWQMAVLDRALIYDGLEEAERLSTENGWSLKLVRLRKLQLSLDYRRTDEIGQLLDALVPVDAAEAGVLRVMFAAMELMVNQFGSDNELAQAARLLVLAARFTTKLIKCYGIEKRNIGSMQCQTTSATHQGCSKNGLFELARFLEVIRTLQEHLHSRRRRPKAEKGEIVTEVIEKLEKRKQRALSQNAVEELKHNDGSLVASGIAAELAIDEGKNKRDPSLESPREMVARWEKENVDIVGIVKDALRAGRIPLAVVQLHHRRCKTSIDNVEPDVFKEVQDVGRSIVYELLCRGKMPIALAALRRLGEDIQTVLYDVAFGTVRHSLRAHATRELRRHGHLEAGDFRLLQTVSLIEGVYPSSRFWSSYSTRQKTLPMSSNPSNNEPALVHQNLQLCCSTSRANFVVECGEIDGVVLGSWSAVVSNGMDDEVMKEHSSPAYWAGAAVWLHAWDQQTIDRVILEQSVPLPAPDIAWESQLKYCVVHHLWSNVLTLIDTIPAFELQESELCICLDSGEFQSSFQDRDLRSAGNGIDAVNVAVPKIKHLTADLEASTYWLWQMVERNLARSHIFLRMYWNGTTEFLSLLARSGLIFHATTSSEQSTSRSPNVAAPGLQMDAIQAIHQIVVRHCVRFQLPCLLQLYLDHHSLGLDKTGVAIMLAIVGDFHWATWLLLSRQRGSEYDASFANARTILSSPASTTGGSFISTIDDLAKFGNELMAISTLLYAPALPQKCLYSGAKRRAGKSWQCALESLSGLERFSTLWSTLKSSSYGKATGVHIDAAMPGYLQWRQSLFSSANGDTSLLVMLPKWLPKAFRKLLHLSIQGPSDKDFVDPVSWEASISKRIEMELYANSSEETRIGIEHHLLQGCPLAAFNHLLILRGDAESSGKVGDLSALNYDEEKLLTLVMPLAITNFNNMVVTAACACFLELCGVSATMLRTDVAALCRISEYNPPDNHPAAKSGDELSRYLSKLLSEGYMQAGLGVQAKDLLKGAGRPNGASVAALVLEHLERASIEHDLMRKNATGSWLRNGEGDGQQLRTLQLSMSERWSLVTTFCRVHHLPLSTTYLACLARDNDWVGFLAEAQAEACPLELLLAVASKHFTDTRLQSHILTVLKGLSPGKASQAPATDSFQSNMPSELFGLLAEIEHHKNPGKDLLQKAKDLRWPLLAVVGSCFNDVSPLSCLIAWLEVTAARETSSIRVSDGAAHLAACVGAAVDATNAMVHVEESVSKFVRRNPKRRRLMLSPEVKQHSTTSDIKNVQNKGPGRDGTQYVVDGSQEHESLAKMVAILCEQQRFLPLLRAFELFLPASPLLHFVRFLRAFSQMRLSEASAHLADFSAFLKEEIHTKGGRTVTTWITKAAVAGADAMLSACPSPYEKRCLLQLLAAADFGDGSLAAMRFRRLYWKIQLAEPSLHKDRRPVVQGSNLEDEDLLTALENSGQWEEARSWARQLDLTRQGNPSAVHHVTEMQAEAMVTEWKELLWDVPEQRAALWRHCQALFTKDSYPPLKAGMFFMKHAEDIEQHGSPGELHEILLLALQWLSGYITASAPVYPLPLLRELETRVWLLAVESEVLIQTTSTSSSSSLGSLNIESSFGMHNNTSPVDRTAAKIAAVDGHLKRFGSMQIDTVDEVGGGVRQLQSVDKPQSSTKDGVPKPKRRLIKRVYNGVDKEQIVAGNESDPKPSEKRSNDGNVEDSAAGWEEKVAEGEAERAVLALVEVGQVSAARQLQQKLSPNGVSLELLLAETAYSVGMLSTPTTKGSVGSSLIGTPVLKTLNSLGLLKDVSSASPLQVMEALTAACREGCGRGHCRRITTVAQIASFLGLPFSEAFQKQPTELLQLLSLKGQDALAEAKLLVATHSINSASIARILAESFLKGLLAAHRGGYMDSSAKEEGPAPLLWRSSDFVQWGQLCPSEPELGHALMRLVISGHDMPHACEVELLILAHQFYESSACLDGMDVLVALAATRVDAYVAEGDFTALARLVTGVSNFQALRFVLDLLIENGRLELLLKKRAAVDANKESSASVRGFRMAVLSALKHFNPHDLDAFGMVFSHFSMAHEMANLLESRGRKGLNHWFIRNDPDQNEELLDIMRFFVEASEVYAGIDCGNRTRWCCAQASLLSLQLRMPELIWLNLTETNARRLLVEQRRFQEALIVAEAYGLNQPAEWVPVLWNQVLSPGWIEHFLSEFVTSLPLHSSMLMELARIYRSEVSARGDQLDFSKWLTAGMSQEITKSFRCILKHVRDFRLRTQLATLASGFPDVLDACARILDKVPDTAGPLILKRGHGGTYVPLM